MGYTPIIHDEDKPELIGALKIRFGAKGFETALPGHPVFLYRDRYGIFLKSDVELRERMFNEKMGGDRTYIGFFTSWIPFYKETLKEHITFIAEHHRLVQI